MPLLGAADQLARLFEVELAVHRREPERDAVEPLRTDFGVAFAVMRLAGDASPHSTSVFHCSR